MGGMDSNETPNTQTAARGFHIMALPPGVPTWIPLVPVGSFAGRDGRGPYHTDEAAIRAAFAAWGMPLMGDYEHQSLNAPDNGQPAPSCGSVAVLEIRDGMLGGTVSWTGKAATMIAAREYLYISPVFDYLPDGTVIRLTGWTLTNNPNLYLPAIARRDGSISTQEKHTMDQERAARVLGWLINELNLPATASADDVISHVTIIRDSLKSTQVAMTQVRAALGLADDADATALVSAAQSRAGNPDPARFVAMADFKNVSMALHTLQTKQTEAAATAAVSAAMTACKVTPGMKDWATDYATRDPEGFGRYLEGAPVIFDAHSKVPVTPPAAGSVKNPLLADAESRAPA